MRQEEAASEGLLLRVFHDEPGRLIPESGRLVSGRAGESAACAWYLEHREIRRLSSTSDLLRPHGRSLSPIDVAGTKAALEQAFAAALATEWRAPTVVAAGWGVGISRLRSGEPLVRAGFSESLPPELARGSLPTAMRALRGRVTALREEMIARGLIELKHSGRHPATVEGRPPPAPSRPPVPVTLEETPLQGWKQIADWLGCSERTARRWEEAHGLPVTQVAASCTVTAFRSELHAWRSRPRQLP